MSEPQSCFVCGEQAYVEGQGSTSRNVKCQGCGWYFTDDPDELAYRLNELDRGTASIVLRAESGVDEKRVFANGAVDVLLKKMKEYRPPTAVDVLTRIMSYLEAESHHPFGGVNLHWHDAQRFRLPDRFALGAALKSLAATGRIVNVVVEPWKIWRVHLLPPAR